MMSLQSLETQERNLKHVQMSFEFECMFVLQRRKDTWLSTQRISTAQRYVHMFVFSSLHSKWDIFLIQPL